MSDDIRARHVEVVPEPDDDPTADISPYCRGCHQHWPCDTDRETVRADKAEAALDAMTGSRDAAMALYRATARERSLALQRELALVQGVHPFDDVTGSCYWCSGGWEQVPGPRGGKGKYVNTGKHREGCAFAASIFAHWCGECVAWGFPPGADVPDHVHEVTK